MLHRFEFDKGEKPVVWKKLVKLPKYSSPYADMGEAAASLRALLKEILEGKVVTY